MPTPSAPANRPAPPGQAARAEAGGIVLFDGHCNFCSGVVNFLIDRDPHGRLKFAALESETGRRLLADHGLPMPDEPDTMVFIVAGKALVRSDAALATTKYLSGLWPLTRFGSLVPRFLRDQIYKLVARNRYRWFGRSEACRVPTPATRGRFLD